MINTFNGVLLSPQKRDLRHESTWVNFKFMIVHERNQAQKDKYCIIPLT